jgi:putative spermidine/putrescine transport system ATP-binding protein
MARLEIENLSKRYGDTIAVKSASLGVEDGEFVVLLGPSGCGKTTTLRMIAGFVEPSDGTVRIGSQDVTRLPPWKRNAGLVFQSYALFPHMTARRNVEFPLLMRHLAASEIRTRVDRALDLVGLGAFASHHPRHLSGGQQQRVALARALVYEPGVLLLDEPLGALDKNLREQMQVEIKRIQREVGITTVYVTHDQTEAMTMSDRVVVMNRGRIEQAAPPLEIYDRPASRFVAEFVGDSNLLEATVDAGGKRIRLEGLGVTLPLAGGQVPAIGRAHALIRPERIGLVGAQDRREGLATVVLTVTGVTHFGDSVLVAGVSGHQSLRARVAGGQARDVREGQEVLLGWRAADVHLIASPEGEE